MIQFKTLRVSGFKSFADRTELDIRPGLNGVVGPNGCGKSNVVEALRWVMGENSAKKMRGTAEEGMEAVIFNGTSARSSRNIAEVSVLLDNSTRTAPPAYNGADEIEVTRKIERDRGSLYKINGKTVRARDVQMLFADTVTGASSPALVSQGAITKIINSKPQERRMILEESAGISGLFARRHEAELRLKAAENNLTRVDDLSQGMEGRLEALKRQARQAARYKNINAQIRELELAIAYLEWQALKAREQEASQAFASAESLTAEKMATVTQLTKTQNEQAQELPDLRKAEVEAAAILQNQRIQLQRIEDEAERYAQALEEAKDQLTQTLTDLSREEETLEENEKKLEQLKSEETTLIERESGAAEKLSEKERAVDVLKADVEELETIYNALLESQAQNRAERETLAGQLETARTQLARITARKDEAESTLKTKREALENQEDFKALSAKIEELQAAIEEQEAAQEKLNADLEDTRAAIKPQREALKEAEGAESRANSEIRTLQSFLDRGMETDYIPALDQVSIESGFEKALSRAMGDSMLAALDDDAPQRWRKRDIPAEMPALPSGAQPIKPLVRAPELLDLALSQIGYVEDFEAGEALLNKLAPGQAIVSKDGHYWRWDGFVMSAEAKDQFSVTLEQKNKLAELEGSLPALQKAAQEAQAALETLERKREELDSQLKSNDATLRENAQTLRQKEKLYSDLRERQAREEAQIANLEENIALAAQECEELESRVTALEAQNEAAQASNDEEAAAKLEETRSALQDKRAEYQNAMRIYDALQQEERTRKARLQALADERISVNNRTIRSKEHVKELDERKVMLQEKLETLKAQPKNFSKDKEKLLDKLSQMESARERAAEKLQERENEVAETGRALKDAEATLGQARENRASAQATLAGLKEREEIMRAEAEEQFDMPVTALADQLSMNIENADLSKLKGQKESLTIDRAKIGAVNLRAEDEMVELEKEVGTIMSEREDLMAAIEELRTGINTINKEARERLLAAFAVVNGHFQRLFKRLFVGGEAKLELIESDDPLGAGLEIFAQPPGKSLQSLTLLSGGEQTMASIALIIAMFLTNPSPICVLDEIDAPLDDANVDRVCDLLEEIAERGETRFLVITHHRLTMARMDYLYGVTMPERGVSQLVSVDLQQSFDFVEAA